MKVTSNANSGASLSPKHFAIGYSAETRFDLVVGKAYDVFGMAIWKSVLLVLVRDESELPNWQPVELFTVADTAIPSGWFFSTQVANEHDVTAIWGYEELATDVRHYEDLLQREPDALALFRKIQDT